jgi:hypothetical protein
VIIGHRKAGLRRQHGRKQALRHGESGGRQHGGLKEGSARVLARHRVYSSNWRAYRLGRATAVMRVTGSLCYGVNALRQTLTGVRLWYAIPLWTLRESIEGKSHTNFATCVEFGKKMQLSPQDALGRDFEC